MSFVRPLFVIVAALGVGKNIMAAKRRAEKHPSTRLADDGDIVIQRPRPAAGIEYRSCAVSERAVERVLSSHRHRWRRGGLNLLLQRRAKDEPVGRQIVFLSYVGQQIVADVELRVNMQVDKTGTNDFSRGVDHAVRGLRPAGAD